MMTSPLHPPAPFWLHLVLIGCFVSSTALAAQPSTSSHATPTSRPPLTADREIGVGVGLRGRSPDEMEYAGLARKLREEDEQFEHETRKLSAADRRKARTRRFHSVNATFAQMNVLAERIARHHADAKATAGPDPIPVASPPVPAKEIEGKTEGELSRMGVAVDALHRKSDAEPATAQAGETSPPAGK